MARSLIINSTDQTGKKLQKTITDINSTAQSDKLKTWAQGLNSLTTNNPVSIIKVETTDLLNGDTTTKLPRNMLISDADAEVKFTGTYNISAAALKALGSAAYSYTITAAGATFNEVAVNYNLDSISSEATGFIFAGIYNAGAGIELGFFADGETLPTGTITLSLPETDQYAAESLTITVDA